MEKALQIPWHRKVEEDDYDEEEEVVVVWGTMGSLDASVISWK